ncbi:MULTISPECIES: hypothetical protein [unclassified Chryseobacterium]|uniref:hypothetical protein n=1 Tax=unclassified Chryseobacterium TaxID=2593645 RepID=UPI0030197F81
MIQLLEILGKDYESLKDIITRTDFDSETLESFSKAGINAPVSKVKLNQDLYFFNFKIEKYKIVFLRNKICQIDFVGDKNKTMEIIDVLRTMKDFEFKFISRQQVEETEWEIMDDNTEEESFTEFKRKRFDFDPSSQFDRNNIDKYGVMGFRSDEVNIIIKEEFIESRSFFVFEIYKIPNIEDFN